MTLIITELSRLGIVMVADSAVTFSEMAPSGSVVRHVLNGAQKLQVIPYLNAGISIWGRGSVPTANGELSIDIWLGDFIDRHSAVNSLDEFATVLTQELQNSLKNDMEPLGFHLAGHVEVEGERVPTFYHVRNVDGTYLHYEHHAFISGHDVPPRVFADNEAYITRNGDYGPYAVLAEAVQKALPLIQANTGLGIPHPSLQGRIAYHAAWVRFVSDLYASSGLLRTIGGSIAALGIYPQDQVIHFPKL